MSLEMGWYRIGGIDGTVMVREKKNAWIPPGRWGLLQLLIPNNDGAANCFRLDWLSEIAVLRVAWQVVMDVDLGPESWFNWWMWCYDALQGAPYWLASRIQCKKKSNQLCCKLWDSGLASPYPTPPPAGMCADVVSWVQQWWMGCLGWCGRYKRWGQVVYAKLVLRAKMFFLGHEGILISTQ